MQDTITQRRHGPTTGDSIRHTLRKTQQDLANSDRKVGSMTRPGWGGEPSKQDRSQTGSYKTAQAAKQLQQEAQHGH